MDFPIAVARFRPFTARQVNPTPPRLQNRRQGYNERMAEAGQSKLATGIFVVARLQDRRQRTVAAPVSSIGKWPEIAVVVTPTASNCSRLAQGPNILRIEALDHGCLVGSGDENECAAAFERIGYGGLGYRDEAF